MMRAHANAAFNGRSRRRAWVNFLFFAAQGRGSGAPTSWFCPIAPIARLKWGDTQGLGRLAASAGRPITSFPDGPPVPRAGNALCQLGDGGSAARPKLDRGMVQEGKPQREVAHRASTSIAVERIAPAAAPAEPPPPLPNGPAGEAEAGQDAPRRSAKRRPAGPPRARIAANDDAPSIGGLIFALQQRPSRRPFELAAIASGAWIAIGAVLAWAALSQEGASLASPTTVVVGTTIFLPIALFWFLALLVWRAQELKLMSSAMTEVAVRLAEPDRAAEQAAASLGQAVRRQVSFMNDAISRALGRAGELEALVH